MAISRHLDLANHLEVSWSVRLIYAQPAGNSQLCQTGGSSLPDCLLMWIIARLSTLIPDDIIFMLLRALNPGIYILICISEILLNAIIYFMY